jgi:small-conductance mechanosensitive channel
MTGFQQVVGTLESALTRLVNEATSIWVLMQIGVILLAAVIAIIGAARLRRRIDLAAYTSRWPSLLQLWLRLFMANLGVVIFALLLVLLREAMADLTLPSRSYLLGLAASLAAGWVVIALVAGLIRNQFVYRLVAGFTWLLWAGYVVGWRQPIRAALNSVGIEIGGLRVTPFLLIKTTVLLLLALWAANAVADALEKRVRGVTDLTPSIQVLIGKLIRLGLLTFAVLIVLSSVGIDFSSLALFSGAIGVGVGFGLQKIVSNLVSGIILLADKSIKPGDVISVGEQFGWVTNMGARYTSVDTRDGREILIPNEDFVTQRVVNWSYSNYRMMLHAEFGVSYASDPHHVIKIAVAAAASVARVIAEPTPVCYFEAFGDSSLNFHLRYWISDPHNGIINVRAAVMLALWDAFKREAIEVPFPQRDLNMRSPVRIEISERGRSPSGPDRAGE